MREDRRHSSMDGMACVCACEAAIEQIVTERTMESGIPLDAREGVRGSIS